MQELVGSPGFTFLLAESETFNIHVLYPRSLTNNLDLDSVEVNHNACQISRPKAISFGSHHRTSRLADSRSGQTAIHGHKVQRERERERESDIV